MQNASTEKRLYSNVIANMSWLAWFAVLITYYVLVYVVLISVDEAVWVRWILLIAPAPFAFYVGAVKGKADNERAATEATAPGSV